MAERISGGGARLTLDRLMALSDGVIAIAITILVLGIDIPKDYSFSEQGLLAFLGRIEHDVVVYAASFCIIAVFWLQHHAIFHYFRYCNRTLIWLNILFLFTITLVPLLAKLKFVYKDEPKVVLLFGTGFILCALILLALWRYAVSKSEILVRPTIDPAVIRSMTRRILVAPLIALVAICVSFVNVRVGTHLFMAIPLFYLSHRLVDTYWEKTEDTSI